MTDGAQPLLQDLSGKVRAGRPTTSPMSEDRATYALASRCVTKRGWNFFPLSSEAAREDGGTEVSREDGGAEASRGGPSAAAREDDDWLCDSCPLV